MGGIELAIAIVSLATELFKYYRKHELADSSIAAKIKEVTNALQLASQSKNTLDIEKSFAALNISNPSGVQDSDQ